MKTYYKRIHKGRVIAINWNKKAKSVAIKSKRKWQEPKHIGKIILVKMFDNEK